MPAFFLIQGCRAAPHCRRSSCPTSHQVCPPRRWLRLLPAIFITYSFAYVDRANYGFGAAAGMAHDLHIGPGASSLLGSLFFLSYFLFQVPGAGYAEQRSAKRLIF